jgi:hypothetical protein
VGNFIIIILFVNKNFLYFKKITKNNKMLKKLTFNRNIYSFFNRNKTNIIPLNATQKHFKIFSRNSFVRIHEKEKKNLVRFF